MQKYFILILVLIVSCEKSDTQKKHHHSEHSNQNNSQIMTLMHQPMMEQEFVKTQNPDYNFLVNMIPHHMGAILSAQEFLKKGENPQIISIASNIIAAQEKEIEEFNSIIATLSTNSPYDPTKISDYIQESEKNMNKMMEAMSSISSSENDAKIFLAGMIPHHEGAVEESKSILKISTNTKIIEIATRIISDQQKEIEEIKNILNSL